MAKLNRRKLYWYYFFRPIFDLLRPMKKVKSAPIVVNPDELRIWMIGHASTLINFFGVTILTDPVLVNWIPYPRRLVAPGYTFKELPKIDYIIISHVHFDHLNKPTLKKLASDKTTLIIPRNCKDLVKKFKYKQVLEIDWGSYSQLDNLEIFAFKTKHWGKRVPWERKNRGFNSYVLSRNGKTVFFCGDSGISGLFKEIGKKYKVDVALLPIGAYDPWAYMPDGFHMDPEMALQTFLDLRADHFIPIHFENFRLSFEPMDEPPKLLLELARQKGLESKIHLLKNGEGFRILP